MRVGIEVGGTFTDLIAIEEDRVQVIKVPSTPSSPEIGAMDALRFSGIDIRSIKELAHGSTVATNAVLERKGGKTAFITTSGFRDILLLQRHGRTRIYDLAYQKPVPVVDRASSYEVSERVLADGSVIELLDQEDVRLHLIPELLGSGYVAVAICLLNSYVNPTHEILLRDILKECAPDIFVTVSSDISREFREYERASTTTLSAYVQPVMERYITNFEELLSREGFSGKFSIMQSNGGRVPGGAMRNQAITALLSGPAAGVTGALHQAKRSGFENLITLDMGGTSTDVCVIANGKAQLTQEYEIGGLPVRIPVTDINTVGAGGGSIIWLDEGGMLRVGPHSAGADPGPACYGRGGRLPTITDAHVVRKTIRAEALLGGRMALSTAAAFSSMESIAEKLGMTVEETADSAIRLADANIVRAIQLISTERGLDPRDFVLVPFGGAGPLHATAVAEELGICRILVPPNSGVISAFGLLASDFATYESLTRRVPLDPASPIVVLKLLSEMKERAFLRSDAMGIGRDCA
ncbi:MAG: hydantoinase/oxoprolinase family protein, partial [Roseovarius sp.]|nr:hydantoinase/oxoprolinase family protein [Roseovarius sp.]